MVKEYMWIIKSETLTTIIIYLGGKIKRNILFLCMSNFFFIIDSYFVNKVLHV